MNRFAFSRALAGTRAAATRVFSIPASRSVPAVRRLSTSVSAFQSSQSAADAKSKAERYFAQYNVYKGKAAMQLSIIPPTWAQSDRGNWVVEREGSLYFQFAPVLPGGGTGVGDRSYNWDKKVTIALKATEAAQLLRDPPPSKSHDFFHDPNKGKDDAGKVSKKLQVSVAPDGNYFFGLTVTGADRVNVPVAAPEMDTIRCIINQSIAGMLGMDKGLRERLTAADLAQSAQESRH